VYRKHSKGVNEPRVWEGTVRMLLGKMVISEQNLTDSSLLPLSLLPSLPLLNYHLLPTDLFSNYNVWGAIIGSGDSKVQEILFPWLAHSLVGAEPWNRNPYTLSVIIKVWIQIRIGRWLFLNSKKTWSRSPKISNSCSSPSVLLCCSNVESRSVVILILLKRLLQMFRYLKLSNYSILLL